MRRALYAFVFLLLGGGLITVGLVSPGWAQDQEVIVVDGTHWQQMEEDQKIAFLAGMMQLVEFERQLSGGTFPAGEKSLVPPLAKGAKGHTIGDMVVKLDEYYQANPDNSDRAVLHALFQAVILPQ
ncbi:MAG: hypothetical protein AAF530_12825 [Pseudomonadota bacterium]